MDREAVLKLLKAHREAFAATVALASEYGHPVPCDTRAWSQILVSMLTGIKGLYRKKGADLADGSDVKAACTWEAIDTPRFNGCAKSGRKGEEGSIGCFDCMPYLFFVLWDNEPNSGAHRCRVWVVRPQHDQVFREMMSEWYRRRDNGQIRSDNMQLHPPRNLNSNVIRNTCGNLMYPLLFCAELRGDSYEIVAYDPDVLEGGRCEDAESIARRV